MPYCKELLIYREGESKKESIFSSFDMYESVYLGNTDEQNFVDYKDNVKIMGFWSKLTCIIAFIICYYEDNVEYSNLDKIYDNDKLIDTYRMETKIMKTGTAKLRKYDYPVIVLITCSNVSKGISLSILSLLSIIFPQKSGRYA